jgi:hypothetical protein
VSPVPIQISAFKRLALGLLFATACTRCGSNSGQPSGDAGPGGGSSGGSSGGPGGSSGGPGGSSGAGTGDDASVDVDASGNLPGSGDGAASAGDGSAIVGASGCSPLVVKAGVKVDGSNADTFTWYDGACLPRMASLIRNDAADAFGGRGGFLRALSYQAAGKTRDIRGTGANGWQGFGYVVSHFGSTGDDSDTQGIGGTYRTVLAGRHHAIHEFKWDISPGGTVHVTVHWMFATGRSHPLFAITLDSSANKAGAVMADSRSPYGDLAWDNGANGDVTGDGWGDTHKFTTTGSGPVTPTSPWDYTKPNTVPYDYEWSTSTDSEMGLVAALSWASKIEGGDYFGGDLSTNKWGKTGTKLLTDIPDSEWPYQLNQYELPSETTSHRICWGASIGAVGAASYTSFGKTLSGYPYQSYTVYVVLGTHATPAVAGQVGDVEGEQGVTLTATRGSVATDGVGGAGRTDKVTFPQAGFDPVYAAWTVDAASNAATVSVNTGAGKITNPVFEIRGYTAAAAPATVSYAGRALVADTDYFATVDAAGQRLWLTLNQTLSGSGTLVVN